MAILNVSPLVLDAMSCLMISRDPMNLLFILWEPNKHDQAMSTLWSFIEICGFTFTKMWPSGYSFGGMP